VETEGNLTVDDVGITIIKTGKRRVIWPGINPFVTGIKIVGALIENILSPAGLRNEVGMKDGGSKIEAKKEGD
jgi:hypothetical protein